MARPDSIISGLLNRGKVVRNVQEEWWSKGWGKTLDTAKSVLSGYLDEDSEDKKAKKYGRDLLTRQRFSADLEIPIFNARSDSSIYSNKTIDELDSTLKTTTDRLIGDFPDQEVEFEDVYLTKKEQLGGYRELNTKYDYYVDRLPELEKFLLDMTDQLAGTKWETLEENPNLKAELKDKLFKGTRDASGFAKFLKENADYFKNNETFNSNSEIVTVGLLGGYNQLITQLSIQDPSDYIVNPEEKAMLLKSIRGLEPAEIDQRNETIAKVSASRVQRNMGKFDKAHEQHMQNATLMNSYDFKREAAIKDGEFIKFTEELDASLKKGELGKRGGITQAEYDEKIQAYIKNSDNWMGQLDDATQINIKQAREQHIAFQNTMNEEDAKFKEETGDTYSDWMNISTPWRKEVVKPKITKKDTSKQEVFDFKGTNKELAKKLGLPESTVFPSPDADKDQFPSRDSHFKPSTTPPPAVTPVVTPTATPKIPVQNIVDGYMDMYKTGSSSNKQKNTFKKKHNLTGGQMSILNKIKGTSLSIKNKFVSEEYGADIISKQIKKLEKSLDPLSMPGLSLEGSKEYYYNWYILGLESRGKKITLDSDTKAAIEEQFPNIKTQKASFLKEFSKQKDQTAANLNKWKEQNKIS